MPQTYFNRPPRIQPELPVGEVQIPNPPVPAGNAGRLGLLTLGLPLVTIIAYALLASRGGNALFIIPMGMAAVVTSIVGYLTWRNNQENERRKQEAFSKRLEEFRAQAQASHEAQMKYYRHTFPEPVELVGMAQQSNPRLWERRPEDPDFLHTRLGLGRRPSTVLFKPPTSENVEAPMHLPARRLAEDFAYLQDAPITIPLAAVTALGIAAANTGSATDFVRALILHVSALHAPSDLRLYAISTRASASQWDWMRWLPHCSGTSPDTPSHQLCFDEAGSARFWETLQAELERRQSRRIADQDAEVTIPYLLVLVDATVLTLLDDVSAQAPITTIMNDGPQLGAAILFVVKDADSIPTECRGRVVLQANGADLFFQYAETGLNSTRHNGKADVVTKDTADKQFASKLASIRVRMNYGGELVNSLNLLELLNAGSPEELHVLQHWEHSLKPSVFWPDVKVGKMAGGKDRILTFSQNEGDGVHGLVAGTTGSGKSQLLMTLVVGLAVEHAPSTVNFVLVDYKGGTAFEALRALPHTVDVITNLQGNAGMRAFVAIGAEMRRRESLLSEHRVQNIGEYYQQGYHLQTAFPHLFIIVDEFAEMIKERPEFKGQLDSIARKGNALGVHLILSTQRPGGLVSDQVQANVKFRICLRVESPEDSRELLGRADATFLPKNIPGRAYLRVGDELNLIQIAQVASLYRGQRVDTQPPVVWLNRPKAPKAPTDGAEPAKAETLLSVMVQYMQRLVQDNSSIKTEAKPWPDPLPDVLPLDTLKPILTPWLTGAVNGWEPFDWSNGKISTFIGLIDDPANARQQYLDYDLDKGHAIVFGVSGSGKTTLLHTVVSGLMAQYAPDTLHFYLLDFGSRGLNVFEGAPHVGAVIPSEDAEKVQRLFRRLNDMLDERKALGNLREFNTTHPESPLPAMLLVIDNFADFRENYPELVDNLTGIAREGQQFGIHIIVTAEQTSALPPRLYNLFRQRFALRLADTVEYSGVVGRVSIDLSDCPGRGLVRVGKEALEFQTASPIDLRDRKADEDLNEMADGSNSLEQLASKMAEVWTGPTPEAVGILPKVVSLSGMSGQSNRQRVAIGMSDLDLQALSIDLKSRGPHFAVVGPPLSGKTTTLRTWILSAAECTSPREVAFILVDFQQRLFNYGGERNLGELPHVHLAIHEHEDIVPTFDQIKQKFEARAARNLRGNPDIIVVIDNYEDLSSGTSHRAVYTSIGELARKYGVAGLHFVAAGSQAMVNLFDGLMPTITAPRYGLGLDTGEAVIALKAKHRATASAEFPPGRGYVVSRGIVQSLVQIATPQEEGLDMEGSLDRWVERISEKYADQRVDWQDV